MAATPLKVTALLVTLLAVTATGGAVTTFGSDAGPLPEPTNITVHDVTGLSDAGKETEGDFIDAGATTNLSINQTDAEREYRFSFRINNTGSQSWQIDSSDVINHTGVNTTWTVNKIWYNISQDYDTGTVSGDTVSWNTSKGGSLAANDVLYAKYLVNISTQNSSTIDQDFLVNDTENASGSRDAHTIDLNKLGFMDLTLNDPPDQTTLQKNDFFLANASITCKAGECGTVSATPRYNASSDTADTVIPSSTATPFYTNNSNQQNCSSSLLKGGTCSVQWDVNASGSTDTRHLLDINASSSYSSIENNDTSDSQVEINKVILMDLQFDVVEFGALTPGTSNNSANGNHNRTYNISFDEDSIAVDDLYISASNIVSEANSDYTIGPTNMTAQADGGSNTTVTSGFSHLLSDISPGSIITTYFWLNVPSGIISGDYSGNITFKANTTL